MPRQPRKGKVTASKKRVAKNTLGVMPESARKSVNITKAGNGYVVSSYTDKGEKTMIAKTKTEAKKHADKLLGL